MFPASLVSCSGLEEKSKSVVSNDAVRRRSRALGGHPRASSEPGHAAMGWGMGPPPCERGAALAARTPSRGTAAALEVERGPEAHFYAFAPVTVQKPNTKDVTLA